jgi:hypothetical protein
MRIELTHTLVLHLSSVPPPSHLHALTSLPHESKQARSLVESVYSNTSTEIQYFVSSASPRPGKDFDHPLNPMKGFLGGKSTPRSHIDDEDEDEENLIEEPDVDALGGGDPPPYDLIYILDAIYHFPPSLPYFLNTALHSLTPGNGIIAYTDIVPPPNLSPVLGYLILPWLLSVPSRNLVRRPEGLEGYKALLEKIGYEGVERLCGKSSRKRRALELGGVGHRKGGKGWVEIRRGQSEAAGGQE